MAIQSLHDVAAGLACSQKLWLSKSLPAGAAARFVAGFAGSGSPAAGVVPTLAGAVCSSADTGAFALVAPVAGKSLYLAAAQLAASQPGSLILYDRLLHNAGLSTNLSSAQSLSLPALSRETSGAGVELWLQVYAAGGATAASVSLSYTNQDGQAGRSASVASRSWANAGELVPVVLQAGDSGVRSVQSVSFATATGSAGSVGVVLQRRLAMLPLPLANVAQTADALTLALPALAATAHLSLVWLASGSGAATLYGGLDLIQA